MCGIDTRALTAWIRENGMPNGVIAHDPNGVFDIDQLKADAKAWSGLEGLDLAKVASSGQSSQLVADALGLERRLRRTERR